MVELDQKIYEQAKQLDVQALGLIYDRYSPDIYSYIYHRVASPNAAEDLTSQTFMRMLEAVRKGNPWRTSFTGWLFRIAHNIVIDYYRRHDKQQYVNIEAMPYLASQQDTPDQIVHKRLHNQDLLAAINKLTEEQAQVVTLRFLEGYSIAEVAQIMDKTEGAIKALQYRAVRSLNRILTERP